MSTNHPVDDWRSEFEDWWESLPTAPGHSRRALHDMKLAAMASWREALRRAQAGTIIVYPES
jgi:hypothetical protein